MLAQAGGFYLALGTTQHMTMPTIPDEVLKEILVLRSENQLEATEQALISDLSTAKAKWTLEETPRYRKAGRSPLYVSGKYLTATGVCPATGEKDAGRPQKTTARSTVPRAKAEDDTKASGAEINEMAFYKYLHDKGFEVKLTRDLLTGALDTVIPAAISDLSLAFAPAPAHCEKIHVTRTTPQIQVTMSFDRFMELAGLKP